MLLNGYSIKERRAFSAAVFFLLLSLALFLPGFYVYILTLIYVTALLAMSLNLIMAAAACPPFSSWRLLRRRRLHSGPDPDQNALARMGRFSERDRWLPQLPAC